ncbi:GNAT family N-acetyltransferase [Anaerocolumna xylanovorans]|uniref:Protein N-acetyltransferase, RimJ/RimL family n=1 Tax=Anaerocolumna xylanovorans DSM 12503 TaxID=1121345 RepID=A0A1M7XWZ3_9FIRM|nr:GNAT family N-acetyltransferase [Anaerocolumna xylanovorans]SHO43360.1 Protein N-acetyltransferase, RimJ/RimL family [Anaerocolumna xylanovorans DSM 12503]
MRLSDRWSTERLVIRKAALEDSKELNCICASWEDKIHMEGDDFPKDYIEDCIVNGDLPPIENADISDYYMMTIQKVNGQIIGFFDLYHGYPDKDTIWISIFVIDKEVQGKAYGQEVIKAICDECKKAGWKSIGLGVYLKNWKGLRFWSNNGFNKIMGIYGDKEYSENTFSIISLRKEL